MTSNSTQQRALRARSRRAIAAAAAMVGALVSAAGTVAASRAPHTTPSSEPAGSSVPTTIGPPITIAAELEQLTGGLLSADVLGVPGDWTIRDIDPSVAANAEQFADTDPFSGLLECPEGTVREGADRAWLARRYSAPEVPLENGLLSIEIIAEVESADDWAEDRDALDDCAVGEYADVAVGTTTLTVPESAAEDGGNVVSTGAAGGTDGAVESVDGQTLDGATVQLLSSPTEAVPYPSAFNATSVNAGERTVTIVVGGVDMGESWQDLADQIAVAALQGLGAVQPPP